MKRHAGRDDNGGTAEQGHGMALTPLDALACPQPVTDCSRGWNNVTLRLRFVAATAVFVFAKEEGRERTQRRGDAALARASCSSMRSVVIYDE